MREAENSRREMSCHHSCKYRLLVQLDIVQSFKCECEVSKKAMNSKEPNYAKVPQHSVQWTRAIFTSNFTLWP